MDSSRRKFLGAAASMAGALFFTKSLWFRNAGAGKSAKTPSIVLPPGQTRLAAAGELLELPRLPKAGDSVCLIVEGKALANPSKIVFTGVPIAGDREDLVLDSLGIFNFSYNGARKKWELS